MALSKDVHIADAFPEHCKELIRRCTMKRKVKYLDFTRVWQEMQFERLYEQKSTGAEIAALSKEAFHVARRLMVSATSTYEESVTALFIIYALLKMQPCIGFASLNLVQEDKAVLQWIEAVADREYRIDVQYILSSVLLKESAGMNCKGPLVIKLEDRPKDSLQTQGRLKKLIKDVEVISSKYPYLQQDIPGVLDYLATNLRELFQKLAISPDSDRSGASTSGQANEIDAIMAIEQQATTSQVNPAEHLEGLNYILSTSTSSESGNKRIKGKSPANKSYQSKTSKKYKRIIPVDSDDETDDTDDDYTFTNILKKVEYCQNNAKTEEEGDDQACGGPSTLKLTEGGATGEEVAPTEAMEVGLEPKLKRLEKRDLKRTILKSRFKRMGLLEVANFPPE